MPANSAFDLALWNVRGQGRSYRGLRPTSRHELRINLSIYVFDHLEAETGDAANVFRRAQKPHLPDPEVEENLRAYAVGAEVVGRFAASILAANPDAAVVVLGDMNEHEFRTPIRRFVEISGMTNLIERVPLAERYTFVYIGNSQILDHVLVSPSLLTVEPEIDIVHVNIDRAASEAASDHDPILVRLRVED